MSTALSPNMIAINHVREVDGLALVEYRPGLLRALPEEIPTGRPSLAHDTVVALLDGLAESEWENWVLDCFAKERGRVYAS